MSDNEKPKTIDERLQYLLVSTESLHNSCQELHAAVGELRTAVQSQMKQMQINERRWERFRKAGTAALEAFLRDDE